MKRKQSFWCLMLKKHCQARHSGPEGWVLLTKVTIHKSRAIPNSIMLNEFKDFVCSRSVNIRNLDLRLEIILGYFSYASNQVRMHFWEKGMKADYSKVKSCCYPAPRDAKSCELDQPILAIFSQFCANSWPKIYFDADSWCFAQILRHFLLIMCIFTPYLC